MDSCSKGNTIIETKMLKSRSRFNDKNALKLTYGHMQIKKFSPGINLHSKGGRV